VESFDKLQKDDGVNIHKPFYCNLHPVESVKFFCNTCQVTRSPIYTRLGPVCGKNVGVRRLT